VDASAERAFLSELEARLAAGEEVEIEVSLSVLAARDVPLEEAEVNAARRRAVQLLATGGDPRRDLDPDGRAVTALATDLETQERKAALIAALSSLRPLASDLELVSGRLENLVADEVRAWRWFACTLLAEELVEE
jgi:ADP-ribose pyrophosphatase YjhB (NUDIX family)